MTMESIAAELGLSRKTVSVVLNGRERQFRLSAATVRRVREHLAQRGYVPSRQARHLRVAPGRVVGILHVDSLYTHLIDAFHRLSGNLSAAVPEGYFGAVFARSGLASKQGLRPANCVGVCDSDYRGEYIVALHNDSLSPRVVRDGVMAQVEIQAGPHRIVSLISREAADELGLEPGVLAIAAVKSTNVVVEVPTP